MNYIDKTASISPCEQYRYTLSRFWDLSKPVLAYVMLNPSTADAMEDDPTIGSCVRIADYNGFGGITVLNLFAFRAIDCKQLRTAADPVGPENNEYIRSITQERRVVVLAWGSRQKIRTPRLMFRPSVVKTILRENGVELKFLRTTKGGDPEHPLFIPRSTDLKDFAPAKAT